MQEFTGSGGAVTGGSAFAAPIGVFSPGQVTSADGLPVSGNFSVGSGTVLVSGSAVD